MKDEIHIVTASIALGFGVTFAITLLFFNGVATLNSLHEGWVEAVFFFTAGLLGLRETIGHNGKL